MRTIEGDIPTWYTGDEWTYTVDPLSFSSPNGSFDGSIQNFRQTVVGIADDVYTISITGDISGDVTMTSFSGELSGDVTGTSQVRVSDLAEVTNELHSQGTITYMWIPFAYELNIYMNSAPVLEVYDFPLQMGEQWQLDSLTTISGSFSIVGVYDQSFEGSQLVDEIVECNQQEQINVPAGTFECFKIGRQTTLSWYSTDVGNMVKTTVDQSGENMTLQMVAVLQSYSFVNQPITISEEISPSIVASGASVVISGQAISTSSGDPVQNGVVSIQIPSSGGSWSTTTNSGGYYSKIIIAPTMNDDTPSGRETGSGGVVVQCSSSGLTGYRVKTLTTVQDNPPMVPSIHGQSEGKPRVSYSYTVVAVDPENDEVFYYVDWGDGTNSSWVGPYLSNENLTLNHMFAKKGTYIIKAQARDIYYATSGWGTLQVTMPTEASAFLLKFFHRFPIMYSLLRQFLGQ
ncbi:MAG TPA: carboxypeptidase-like regulatory domain-containing protein [Candidatus Thermoplasmatota archaeon]|nr:carboxypeptidase-like regulatory domain-containing protein [Candidatus Thermoplasmatota archaeon]